MSLAVGTRFGAFEITSTLGVGGMGEVYRARDTRLNRDAAIKVLLPAVAADPDRLARFQREAHVLAALNHPNIAQIYGLEESDGVRALVMELVDGPTLADRIALGPIPWSEAKAIAVQIGDALETAHDQGIIHRDLKPANIKVRTDGVVKVLDFGLAKAFDAATAPQASAMSSPTLTAATEFGIILGTAAYMSPEQAKGRAADRRSDVWGFGCVLYELLTGRRAFAGDDVSEVLASVLKTEPDWAAFAADVPAHVISVVKGCLRKNRNARIPEVAAVRFLLDEATRSNAVPQTAVERRPWWKIATGLAAAGVAGAAVTALLSLTRTPPAAPSPVARFDIVLPAAHAQVRGVAISPDGQTIVYSASRQLFVRTLSDPVVRPLSGATLAGIGPFFSPDGNWVGFYAPDDSALKKIALSGGAPVTICPLNLPGGAVWTPGGDIIVAVAGSGISRVPAAGGAPSVVIPAKTGESMQSPQMLPDGDHIVFASTTATGADRWDKAQIVVQSLKSGDRRVLVEGGSNPRVTLRDRLVYVLGTTALSVGFDTASLTVGGSPVPLVQRVARTSGPGLAGLAVAENGTIVHLLDSAGLDGLGKLALVDRTGTRTLLSAPDGQYSLPRVSPDGKHVAVRREDQGRSAVWVYDLSGASSLRRLTFEPATTAIWTRDSRRIIFGSSRQGGSALYWLPADGSGSEERLTALASDDTYFPNDLTVDGRTLAFFSIRNGGDVLTIALDGDHTPKPLVALPTTHQDHLSFSRDGRWMAYRSNESGSYEIYVQPYPPTGAKYQVTTTGAHSPLWSPDGRQLFYVDVKDGPGRLGVVDVRMQPGFSFSNPAVLPLDVALDENLRPYDVTPDGKQLVVVVPASARKTDQPQGLQLRVTLNAAADLTQPTGARK